MEDIQTYLSRLKRPRLLVRTAKRGAPDYKRDKHLGAILARTNLPGHGEALLLLTEIESLLEERRKERKAGYSFARHISVLIALINEASLHREKAQMNASGSASFLRVM